MDHTRDPCPWVALNDFGGAFCMGVRYIPLPNPSTLFPLKGWPGSNPRSLDFFEPQPQHPMGVNIS